MKTLMIMMMLVGAHAGVLVCGEKPVKFDEVEKLRESWYNDALHNQKPVMTMQQLMSTQERSQRRCCCWRRKQDPVSQVYVELPSGRGMWMPINARTRIGDLKRRISTQHEEPCEFMYAVQRQFILWKKLTHVPNACHLNDAVSTHRSCKFRASPHKLHDVEGSVKLLEMW